MSDDAIQFHKPEPAPEVEPDEVVKPAEPTTRPPSRRPKIPTKYQPYAR